MTRKCDQCDEPAITLARDTVETEPVDMYEEWVSVGEPRAGCEDHPVRSVLTYRDGRVEEV